MATTITIKGSNLISEKQRAGALQFMADNLSDDELNKLHQLAKSSKSRNALATNWDFIQAAFI